MRAALASRGASAIAMAPEIDTSDYLRQGIGDYQRWREDLVATVRSYQSWVEQEGLANGEDDLRVYDLIDSLRSDKLTIAIVGEFSRGKTELINAIFFADYKQRLLPTEAGRTTMCPTEIEYDPKLPPCIRLLPIETRQGSQTIAELKRTGSYWTSLPLDLDSPAKTAEVLGEIIKTKNVTAAEARSLGLYNPTMSAAPRVDVPVWRHAIINYPHPLLKRGLVILDTPGLNALGSEPELTMSMLPAAHVVIFVLAADTGVTKSDLAVWREHVCVAKGDRQEGRLVVLNKTDTLWDELRGHAAVEASISRQAQETAAALEIHKNQVFPLSAQKGLLAKIKQDSELLERSGLLPLEQKLSHDTLLAKQDFLRQKVVREIGGIVRRTAATVETRLAAVTGELEELQAVSGKNQSVIENLMAKKTEDQQAYEQKMAKLENIKQVLGDQVNVLRSLLSMQALDELIMKTRADMKGSWTTHGLKTGMKTFFEGAMQTMEKVHKQTERMKGLLESIYKQFQVGHGLAKLKLDSFALDPHYEDLKRLYRKAETFRNSPTMVMTEQHFVVKRFFITLVSRARHLFDECNKAAHLWSNAVMAPVFAQIREHKRMMDQRIENLQKIHHSMRHLNERMAELTAAKRHLEEQQAVNQSVLGMLGNAPAPATQALPAGEASPREKEARTEELLRVQGAA